MYSDSFKSEVNVMREITQEKQGVKNQGLGKGGGGKVGAWRKEKVGKYQKFPAMV